MYSNDFPNGKAIIENSSLCQFKKVRFIFKQLKFLSMTDRKIVNFQFHFKKILFKNKLHIFNAQIDI